jgi:4-hydroxymandelate oxidase
LSAPRPACEAPAATDATAAAAAHDALRAAAHAVLDPAVWAWLDGDAAEGAAKVANRMALDRYAIWPRALVDVRGGHTRCSLFGLDCAHPLLLAPIAYQRLLHADGERASAMAAAAQDGLIVISSLASQRIEDIVAAAEGRAWFQLYWQHTRERTLRLAQRAIDAGCRAVVFTVDAPVKQATLALPAGITAVNLAPPLPLAPGPSAVFDGWMAQASTWDDAAWLRDRIGVPLLVKGVLHPDDAARCRSLGVDGLVVSNHGGRVLAAAPAALDALPAVVARVGAAMPVLFDSGLRSGADAFRALALGARAVLIGRPAACALAAQGALGVAQLLRRWRDELEMTMALAGCRRLDDIGRASLCTAGEVVAGAAGCGEPVTARVGCAAGSR